MESRDDFEVGQPDRVAFDDPSDAELACTDCCEPLQLVQPEEQLPQRLLGACPSCHTWFLVLIEQGKIIPLPETVAPHE